LEGQHNWNANQRSHVILHPMAREQAIQQQFECVDDEATKDLATKVVSV